MIDHSMKMQSFRRILATVALSIAAAACTTHRPPKDHFAQKFITQGQPKVDLGGPVPMKGPMVEDYVRKLRHLAANARPQSAGSLIATIETRDPELSRALALDTLSPTPVNHVRVGDAYFRLKIRDTAHRYYQRALRADSEYGPAFEGLARVWRDWNLPALALGDAHRATHFSPRSAKAWNTLGTVLQALDQRQDARRAYQRAFSVDPSAAYALNNLCYLSLLDGKINDAVRECRQAIQIQPSFLAATNNLALAYAASGQSALAETLLLTASDSAVAHYNVGIVRMARRQYVSAAQAFDRARALKPTWRAANERARQARTEAKKPAGEELQ
jgi:Flp pilus assembly protein TadD